MEDILALYQQKILEFDNILELRQWIRTNTDNLSSLLAIVMDARFDEILPAAQRLQEEKNWQLLDILKTALLIVLEIRIITNSAKELILDTDPYEIVTKGDLALIMRVPQILLDILFNSFHCQNLTLQSGYFFFTSYKHEDKSLWEHLKEGRYNFTGYSLSKGIKSLINIPSEIRATYI